MGDPLGHAPGIDEHQRGPVAGHVARDHVQDLRRLLHRGDRAELVVGQLQGQVQPPAVARIHDRAPRRPVRVVPVRARADQQPGDGLDRPLGGGQAHPLHRLPGDVRQPFQGEGQVRAALVSGHRVNLVHDHGAHAAQHGPAALRGQQQVERLRRGDQNVRRALEHGGPLGGRGVSGPHRDADGRRGQAEPPATATISRSGASRFCWMSVASAFSGDTYTTCGPDPTDVAPSPAPAGAPSATISCPQYRS